MFSFDLPGTAPPVRGMGLEPPATSVCSR